MSEVHGSKTLSLSPSLPASLSPCLPLFQSAAVGWISLKSSLLLSVSTPHTIPPQTPPLHRPLHLLVLYTSNVDWEHFPLNFTANILPDLPEQLLNQLVSMTTDDVEETPPREMISDLSTLTPEDLERLEVVDDTIQQ